MHRNFVNVYLHILTVLESDGTISPTQVCASIIPGMLFAERATSATCMKCVDVWPTVLLSRVYKM